MMGEGFNFPRLKIAAVHSPHKSLEVTLQFIGRFARTNAPDIGEAKFVAVLNDIEIERNRLFDEGAVWQEIIPELSYGRIASEIHIREAIEEFRPPVAADASFADLSLYSLHPRSHVKLYDVQGEIDLRNLEVPSLAGQEIWFRSPTEDGSALVLITRQIGSPKWSAGDTITNVVFELYVLFHDPETSLLFINSSKSVDGTYESLAAAVSGDSRPLATGQVGKVVKEITNKRIFNIGMRNIQAANTRESYKIIAASDAQIDRSEARRYRQGHVFLSGEEGGERTTIGYSSGGKVWSTLNTQIPELLDWCRALGQKIRSAGPVVTHSGLDYLDAGRVVEVIPRHLIYAQWNRNAFDFTTPAQVEYTKADGTQFRGHIVDLDLNIDRTHTDQNRIRVQISGDGLDLSVDFSLTDFYTAVGRTRDRITVTRGNYSCDLIEYLNDSNLDFCTADGSLFSGNELFEPKDDPLPIDLDRLTTWDWAGVEIEHEIEATRGELSVHEKVRERLEQGPATIILYDHGSGEVADYVTIAEDQDTTTFVYYHCKGSAKRLPGARVDDVFEVCGQAQKSVAWASLARLELKLRYHKRASVFIRGNQELLRQVLERAKDTQQRFEIKIVQPGISKARLTQAMSECLGATNGHLIGVSIAPLEILASA